MDMEKVILYSKLNCPLCQDAYLMLMEITLDIPLEIDLVDITHTHNDHLYKQYADRIPVLARPHGGAELDWPFTPLEVKAFLTSSILPGSPDL
jgi:hypothetical protein